MSNQMFYCKVMALALIMLLIICSGDIETNPGPKKNTKISFCHWNLSGIAAHNFSKVSLLQAIATTHEYNIICLPEIFLDSSFDSLDDQINTEGYKLLRLCLYPQLTRGRCGTTKKQMLDVFRMVFLVLTGTFSFKELL